MLSLPFTGNFKVSLKVTCPCMVSSRSPKYVTARPNLPYIVCFRPYRPHSFVLGEVSSYLSLTLKNVYDKLATNTLNKASYQPLIRRCGIWQFTPLKEPNDPVSTTGQPARSALKPNVTTRPNLPYIFRIRLTSLTVLFLVTRAHIWAWRPKMRMTS